MKPVLTLLGGIACLLLSQTYAYAQGCVAIRSNGNVCMLSHPDSSATASQPHTVVAFNTRYFRSFRHFSGTEENKARLEQGTEVINKTATFDINILHVFNSRWSVMADIPVVFNTRSSLYEHGLVNGTNLFNERHSMHSSGLADVRLAAYYWLLNPHINNRGNIQTGLGVKLPTGRYNYKDYWHNVGTNGAKELRPVDQSIQPGDGGTGITFETNLYYNVLHNVGLYGNVYYLSNPRGKNGTRTYRETLVATLANEDIMSVPDQYMVRGGVNFMPAGWHRLALAAGMRLEGIPVHDLIGSSEGFRRPGYVWSAEPSVSYAGKKLSAFASVPVALVRNRTQSVTDKANSLTYGKHIQGDAAFADYVVNAGIALKF